MNDKNTNITLERILELMGNDTQEVFGKKINMSQPNVSKMLKGTPPSAATLIEMARVYNVSVDWLLGVSDHKQHTSNLDVGSLTYSDVLAVIDRLYENGTIRTGYDSNGYGNEPDPGILLVQDKILLFLLEGMDSVSGNNADIAGIWKNKTYQEFCDVPILRWNEQVDALFEQNKPEKNSNKAISRLAKDIQEEKVQLRNHDDFMTIPNDELPFQ